MIFCLPARSCISALLNMVMLETTYTNRSSLGYSCFASAIEIHPPSEACYELPMCSVLPFFARYTFGSVMICCRYYISDNVQTLDLRCNRHGYGAWRLLAKFSISRTDQSCAWSLDKLKYALTMNIKTYNDRILQEHSCVPHSQRGRICIQLAHPPS